MKYQKKRPTIKHIEHDVYEINVWTCTTYKWISRFVSVQHCDFLTKDFLKAKSPIFLQSVSDFQHIDLYYTDCAFKVFKEVSEESKEVLRWKKLISAVQMIHCVAFAQYKKTGLGIKENIETFFVNFR